MQFPLSPADNPDHKRQGYNKCQSLHLDRQNRKNHLAAMNECLRYTLDNERAQAQADTDAKELRAFLNEKFRREYAERKRRNCYQIVGYNRDHKSGERVESWEVFAGSEDEANKAFNRAVIAGRTQILVMYAPLSSGTPGKGLREYTLR